MNYRHAYHAGNFADCMKHALFVWLLQSMARKDKPFMVLDTHAGIGRYDLQADEAQKTGEWRDGIARLLDDHDSASPLAPYLGVVRDLGPYPGSPAIAQALLRDTDRLVCCELHPIDLAELRRQTGRDKRIHVHLRDGYEALGAFLPPPERRGLILIDPPYEATDEFDRLLAGLRAAHAKFPGGVVAAWYPIKHRAPIRAFHDSLRPNGDARAAGSPRAGMMRDIVAAEFLLRDPLDAARLNGCGLLVVNPPYGFEAGASAILDALLARLGQGEPGAGTSITRIVDE